MPPGNRIETFIDADPSNFRAGFGDAQKAINGFKKDIAGLVSGAAIVRAVRDLGKLSFAAVRSGADLKDQARAANIGAAALQEYRSAARETNTSQKALDSAIQTFTRNLGSARAGTRRYRDEFRSLGVDITQTNENALSQTLEKLEQITDVSQRASAAQAIFGEQADEIARLTSRGAGGIAELRAEAHELGLVLSDEVVEALANAQAEFDLLDQKLGIDLKKTVAENVEGLKSVKTLLNEISKAAIELAGNIGLVVRGLDQLNKNAASTPIAEDQTIANLKRKRDNVRTQVFEDQKEIARLEATGSSRFFAQIAILKNKVDANQKKNLELDFLIQRLRATEQGAGPPGSETPPPIPPDLSGVKVPGVPTFKQDAILKESVRRGKEIARVLARAQSPVEKLRAELQKIEELRPFAESSEELIGLAEAAARVQNEIDILTGVTVDWGSAIKEAGRGIAETFADAVFFSDNLGKSLGNVLKRLGSRLLSEFLFNAIHRRVRRRRRIYR